MEYAEELLVSLVIILVAFASFYLGRVSITSSLTGENGITIENEYANTASTLAVEGSLTTLDSQGALSKNGPIVASKNGKKYYFEGCSGISRISPANIVHYTSAAEAERFGLTLAANCIQK